MSISRAFETDTEVPKSPAILLGLEEDGGGDALMGLLTGQEASY